MTIIHPLKRRKLFKLINRFIVCCSNHNRSLGPFWGAGHLAQCQGATLLKTGLDVIMDFVFKANWPRPRTLLFVLEAPWGQGQVVENTSLGNGIFIIQKALRAHFFRLLERQAWCLYASRFCSLIHRQLCHGIVAMTRTARKTAK